MKPHASRGRLERERLGRCLEMASPGGKHIEALFSRRERIPRDVDKLLIDARRVCFQRVDEAEQLRVSASLRSEICSCCNCRPETSVETSWRSRGPEPGERCRRRVARADPVAPNQSPCEQRKHTAEQHRNDHQCREQDRATTPDVTVSGTSLAEVHASLLWVRFVRARGPLSAALASSQPERRYSASSRRLGQGRQVERDVVDETRYRCGSCGNLTRFDVVQVRRTRSFHHYSVGGALTVEEVDVLSEEIESVICRWCDSGAYIVTVDRASASGGVESS